MSVILFIIILAALILVHELGHFIAAKRSGVRVDEFGLGLPPRLWGKKVGETIYSFNWIPFGGFVRIFGEDPSDPTLETDPSRSFVSKKRHVQAIILAAGVFFNILFAWLLLSIGLMIGAPAPASYDGFGEVRDPKLVITGVVPDAPAIKAGLKAGDEIIGLGSSSGDFTSMPTADEAFSFIEKESDNKLTFSIRRGGEITDVEVTPEEGIISDRKAVGVGLEDVGLLKLSPPLAVIEGARLTGNLLKAVTVGLYDFIKDAIFGKADFSAITGPVGIAGMVGEASSLGLSYVLTFTALISLHLAVINLVPFPALDGGRILFVAIEAIKRSPMNPRAVAIVNGIGFSLLILLMIVITYRDIARLF